MDLTKHGHQYPLEAYVFGSTYQIRDKMKRTVCQLQFLTGDILFRKKTEELIKHIVELLNNETKGQIIEEIKKEIESNNVLDNNVNLVNDVNLANKDIVSNEPQVKKRRGRPPKSKANFV